MVETISVLINHGRPDDPDDRLPDSSISLSCSSIEPCVPNRDSSLEDRNRDSRLHGIHSGGHTILPIGIQYTFRFSHLHTNRHTCILTVW